LILHETNLRDQGVGGSNPLSPTNISRDFTSLRANFLKQFSSLFGTFGTNRDFLNFPHQSFSTAWEGDFLIMLLAVRNLFTMILFEINHINKDGGE
jgi:hypothetical protein